MNLEELLSEALGEYIYLSWIFKLTHSLLFSGCTIRAPSLLLYGEFFSVGRGARKFLSVKLSAKQYMVAQAGR
jgi:hypothetical protein